MSKVSVSAAHTDESLRGEIPWQQIPPTGREKRPCRVSFKQSLIFLEVCCDGRGVVGEGLFSTAWMKPLEWILCCLCVLFSKPAGAPCSSVCCVPFGTMWCHWFLMWPRRCCFCMLLCLLPFFFLWTVSYCTPTLSHTQTHRLCVRPVQRRLGTVLSL